MTDAEEGCAAFIAAWLFGWVTGAIRAAVAMKGWEWFVADTFGAPTLGFIEAWGLFLLISFATYHLSADRSEKRPLNVALEALAMSLMWSALTFVSLLILVSIA